MKPVDTDSLKAIDASLELLGEKNRGLLESIYGCGFYDGQMSMLNEKIFVADQQKELEKP